MLHDHLPCFVMRCEDIAGNADFRPLSTIAGIAVDPSGTHVIAAMSYTGELAVGGRVMTAADLDAVIVVMPTP